MIIIAHGTVAEAQTVGGTVKTQRLPEGVLKRGEKKNVQFNSPRWGSILLLQGPIVGASGTALMGYY